MGRRAHQPDAASRRQVEAMAGYGVPETEIGEFLCVDPKTLRKHYRLELKQGHIKANSRVAESLYRKATGEGSQSVTAAIFWLNTRAGWRESIAHELSGPAGGPIEVADHSTRELAKAVLMVLSRGIAPEPQRLPAPGMTDRLQ